MCCTRLVENYRTQKLRQKSPSAHHRTTLSAAISPQLRHVSTIGKKFLNCITSSICSHNMLNFDPLTAEICWRVWAPQQISTGFASLLRYCTDVAHRRSTELCTMFGRLLRWYTPCTFGGGGSCPLTEFCQLQNSLCVQVLRSPTLAALLHGTQAVGVSQSLRHGTRNGITEVSQTAPPIFGRAAIMLGIGPHCSLLRIDLTFKMHILERINKFNSRYHTFPLQTMLLCDVCIAVVMRLPISCQLN